MNILSIQSGVCYGHVGNAAAVFPLQRLGHEVWPVETVTVSNHLGYPTWRGRFRSPDEIAEIIDGLDKLGALARCDAVLSGYLGDAGNGEAVLDAVARTRRAHPPALYACDPVMGDRAGGLFVKPAIPAVFAEQLLPATDIAFPNAFELEQLTGATTDSLASALAAAEALRSRMRPQAIVVITSLQRADGPADQVEVLAAGDDGAWIIAAPRHPVPAHGAGDCFAALFLGHYLKSLDIEVTLGRAVTAIDAILAATAAAGSAELALIAAQNRLDPATPSFQARRAG